MPPRVAAVNDISNPAEGLVVFEEFNNCIRFYNGTEWSVCVDGAATWEVDCGGITTVVEVESAGYTWMDRNMGATQVATSSTDANSYGDLYQWGRCADGHQIRTSSTTSTNATTAVPNDGNSWDGKFITEGDSPYDWLTPQNDNLWQGAGGTNNPCPSGFRLSTLTELNNERLSWATNNAAGAYGSALKLTLVGYRDNANGSIPAVGDYGNYWSSTVDGIKSRYVYFYSGNAAMHLQNRAHGFAVRCLKD
ncbi:MAG: hypothetical protein GY770_02345 [Aestuariibacter sp.]|nr:hypothetical protein [Aestuariibacter sp.]